MQTPPIEKSSASAEPPRTTKAFLSWLFARIWRQKKYWLLPVWAFLVALGIALYLTGNGALLPAIYLAF
jgi:hypothetical protein